MSGRSTRAGDKRGRLRSRFPSARGALLVYRPRATMSLSIPPPDSPAPSDLEDAVAAAMLDPESSALWDAAERLAEAHDRPEDVARAYAEAVEKPLPSAYTLELCRRAYDFVSQ